MFRLLKFYLDLVTEDGTALIGYAARLRVGRIELGYSSLLLSPPGGAPLERATLEKGPLPDLRGDQMQWSSPALALAGEWRSRSPPLRQALLQGRHGAIHWSCHMPRAAATVMVGGQRLTGTGYVESLRLTIAPWRLPFRVLRWGRYASRSRSLVWIDWGGGDPARWIWLDGQARAGGLNSLGLDLADETALRFDDRRDVRNRGVFEGLGAGIGRLLPAVAARPRSMHEHKELSRATLTEGGRTVDRGWALHEEVTW